MLPSCSLPGLPCCAGHSNFFPLVLATSRNSGILYMQTVRTVRTGHLPQLIGSFASWPNWSHLAGPDTCPRTVGQSQHQRTFPTADLVTLAFIMATLVHALRHPSAEFLLLGCTTCPWHSPSHWHLTLRSSIMAMGNPHWKPPRHGGLCKSENLLCPWANCPLPSRTNRVRV